MSEISAESFGILQRMHQEAGIRPPDPARFVITQPAPPTPEAPAPVGGTSPPAPPDTTEGWDPAEFDALPEADRVKARTLAAGTVARAAIESLAERWMLVPSDALHHLTDLAKYVDSQGRVNRDAILQDVHALVDRRPELGRRGVPLRAPDWMGATLPAGRSAAEEAGTILDRMHAELGTKPANRG